MWEEARVAWSAHLPQLERFPAVFNPTLKPGYQHYPIKRSFANAIATLETNDDPFVLVLEDDAFPFPEFDALWPEVLEELVARPDEWDVLHGCPRFGFGCSAKPVFGTVPCSRALMSLSCGTAGHFLVFSRSILSIPAYHVWKGNKGRGPADTFFTANKGEYRGNLAHNFRLRVPRRCLAYQNAHVSATTGKITDHRPMFKRTSDRLAAEAENFISTTFDIPCAYKSRDAAVPGAVSSIDMLENSTSNDSADTSAYSDSTKPLLPCESRSDAQIFLDIRRRPGTSHHACP